MSFISLPVSVLSNFLHQIYEILPKYLIEALTGPKPVYPKSTANKQETLYVLEELERASFQYLCIKDLSDLEERESLDADIDTIRPKMFLTLFPILVEKLVIRNSVEDTLLLRMYLVFTMYARLATIAKIPRFFMDTENSKNFHESYLNFLAVYESYIGYKYNEFPNTCTLFLYTFTHITYYTTIFGPLCYMPNFNTKRRLLLPKNGKKRNTVL